MKLRLAVWAALLSLALVGCGSYREADRQYIVSALGFDSSGGGLTVSAESLVVNSESTDREIATEIFTASGSTPAECIYALGEGLSKRLLLSHCGVIAVGDGVNEQSLAQILEYCRSEEDISLSAYLVSTSAAGELLSGEAVSALTAGYEIMGMLDRSSQESGIMYGSRIYEIEDARLKRSTVFMLPRFSVREEKRFLEGAAVYLGDKKVLQMNGDETAVYSLVRNANRGGKVSAGGYIYNVKAPYTYFEADFKNGALNMALDIRISPEGTSEELCDWIKLCAEGIIERANGADVFGLADRIYAESGSVWQRIENDPVALAAAQTQINCRTRSSEHEN